MSNPTENKQLPAGLETYKSHLANKLQEFQDQSETQNKDLNPDFPAAESNNANNGNNNDTPQNEAGETKDLSQDHHLPLKYVGEQSKKLKKLKNKHSVNFLDPRDLPSAIKHINQSVVSNQNIEELRSGLSQRKKDVFLAALNQPYHTKKFQEVMNQINQMSTSPEKLKDVDELKDYNHVVKVQKRIFAEKMKPKLEQIQDRVAIVGADHEKNNIDTNRELFILENEEENPHYQPRKVTLQNEDKDFVPHRNIKSEASLDFSRILDSASDLVDFLDSPTTNKAAAPTVFRKESREVTRRDNQNPSIVLVTGGQSPVKSRYGDETRRGGEDTRRSAPTYTWVDMEPKKTITFLEEKVAKPLKVPRYRRKSDVSHYYGGECKKLAAVSNIILPTDIRYINPVLETIEKEDLKLEKTVSIQPTRTRGQTLKNSRNAKTMVNLEPRSRTESFNLQRSEVASRIAEEPQMNEVPNVQEEASNANAKSTGMGKGDNFRVLLQNDQKTHSFAPINIRGLKADAFKEESLEATPKPDEADNQKAAAQELQINKDDFANRFLVLITERKVPDTRQKNKLLGRSASQPKVRNPAVKDPETEKNKEIQLGLDATLRLNGKAKMTLFKTPAKPTNSQRLPPITTQSNGVKTAEQTHKAKGNDLHSKNKRSASVVPERKYSIENFEMRRNQPPQPYFSRLPYCRPAHDSEVGFEAFEVGIGPKFGPFQSEFRYDRMSQTAIKIKKKGSNFYLRT